MNEEKEKKIVDIEKASPMMRQYMQVKEEHPDCVLFFRLGDFYELFNEDAIEISQVLDLTLTGKNVSLQERAPMCGVPYHAADEYIAKLVGLGYKVAICEQTGEIVKGSKDPVKREVVRIVTAGTVTEPSMLDENKNNFLMSLFVSNTDLGVAYCDISTGQLNVCHFGSDLKSNFSNLLSRVQPAQVIGDARAKEFYNSLQILKLGVYPKFEQYLDYAFESSRAKTNVLKQFGDNALKVYELQKEDISAVGGLLEYFLDTQKRNMKNLVSINKIKNSDFMAIDANTRRNLELCENIRERKKYGSLLWLMDKTKTSMGARRLRAMFDQPLQNFTQICDRLEAVEELVKNLIMRDRLCESLSRVRDIERLCGKLASGSANPTDLLSLKVSLAQIPEIKQIVENVKSKKLVSLKDNLKSFDEIVELLENAIKADAGALMREGGYIKDGFNEDLDQLRNAKSVASKQCEELEQKEKELTGISKLKISFNNVFGFFIEVPKGQSENVPLRYVRKQTLANAERYTTPELKLIEDRILSSKEDSLKLEEKLYGMLVEYLVNFLKDFSDVANALAQFDALLSLAQAAVKYNFCKPNMVKSGNVLEIVEGRHPIVENFAKEGSFIANDTLLDGEENQVMIITGPNMAGKSTYMRQVAIITFLAHIGSFVPAKSAQISITDRIFTRVGASDDLAFGQSTFMVEMSEVANILANATDKSLVVLDEIGRGTSTFDGLAIAWAVVEYICKHLSCKTLFATHYHELSELEGVLKGVKNFKSTVKEVGDSVVFLRKIVRGAANKSFGVEVARLAGVPNEVLSRAKEISINLEKVNQKLDVSVFGQDEQRAYADAENKKAKEVLAILKDLDINKLSPIESFMVLQDLLEHIK